MLKIRFIAVLVIRDGQVVQSEQFRHPHVIHKDPVNAIECFNKWAVDEIVAINVSRNESSAIPFLEVIDKLSVACFVPLSVGGWVCNIEYARGLLKAGADKIIINTQAYKDPEFIEEMSEAFGSQCVVVSIDAKMNDAGLDCVCIDRGRFPTETPVVEWALKATKRGAGELFINSIEHDGKRKGYHLELIKKVVMNVSIPVIAFGGVFKWSDLIDGIKEANADAVAAANILHYTEHSCKKAKRYLFEHNLNIRK